MICASLVDLDRDQCVSYCRQYPFVEFRVDRLSIASDQLPDLIEAANTAIVTCRQSRRDQLAVYQSAIKASAAYIDMELSENPDLLASVIPFARTMGVRVILSAHDYEQTPPENTLYHWIDQAVHAGADIVKIACRVHTMEDNIRLLRMYRSSRYADIPKVVLGMGEAGVLTRVLAPLLGAPFTFAFPDDAPSAAPGQLQVSVMEALMDLLLGGHE